MFAVYYDLESVVWLWPPFVLSFLVVSVVMVVVVAVVVVFVSVSFSVFDLLSLLVFPEITEP